jgi:hypothetical protein
MTQARVFNPGPAAPQKNPCSTCGFGVPPTPGGSVSSAGRRAWAMSQVAAIPNPGPDPLDDEDAEQARVRALQNREVHAGGPLRMFAGPGPGSSAPQQWHPYRPSLPPTLKAARVAARRYDAAASNPGWGTVAGAMLATAAGTGYAGYRYLEWCQANQGKVLAHGTLGGWHRYLFHRGCDWKAPYEVVVTFGALQYKADGKEIANQEWETGRYGTFEEASGAMKLEDYAPKTLKNPQTSTVLAPWSFNQGGSTRSSPATNPRSGAQGGPRTYGRPPVGDPIPQGVQNPYRSSVVASSTAAGGWFCRWFPRAKRCTATVIQGKW